MVMLLSAGAGVAFAQPECRPGDEFCEQPPPCYREPDNPDCNPDCTCDSPDYPACDPRCAPGDLTCDPNCGNPCWDEFDRNICTDPPPPCEPSDEPPFEFIDDMDGNDNGEIFARGDRDPFVSCGTILVDRTGYYSIFDTELSESCDDQKDETGYLTIENSCNGEGWAVERNAGERFLVFDSDNSPDCESDGDCGAGEVCREGNSHGRCCVPADPVFMGTFLLVEGEPNRICIRHWCPEWSAEIEEGQDYGFVIDGCGGANSIHFRIGATAIACEDERTLQPCSWGCDDGACNPDPCDSVSCDAFCRDGECMDANPCEGLNCTHGCFRGYCLQNPHARGPDADGDGFSNVAECDDNNADVNPNQPERCGNGIDDNCNGFADEMPCDDGSGSGSTMDGGSDTGGTGSGSGDGGSDDGCGCSAAEGPKSGALVLLTLLGLAHRSRTRKSSGR